MNWLLEGDNNTKFFHRVVKSRGNKNRILMVLDEDGRWVSGKAMKEKFVNHFKKFLGCEDITEFSCLNDGFFHNKLDSRVALNMIRVVTDEEIKVAMFDIDDNRAPARVIRDALDDFKKVSGLKASMEKSQIFFSCVKPNMRRIILGILPFDIGKFPFKYLGIPMCVTKLFCRDCKQLVGKIKMRILNWKSKALSFAGRLQLINYVLTTIHVSWASIFKIPIATIREVEKICRSYLWANGEIVKGKAKVKWIDICRPKDYGGLGVKNLRKWNDALLAKHVWNMINNKNSLWVQWVKKNYIGDRNFWDILQKKSMSWTWKRFLEVRKIVRPHVVSCVGNGMNTSLWHDWWHPIGILSTIISRRDWIRNGFSDISKVSDVMVNDFYLWPVEWVIEFPGLKDGPMFCIDANQRDVTGWRDKNGVCKQFSCKQVWRDINNFGDKVPWYDIVWYGNCIPRNSFILWLAILNRLKTQDRVKGWEISGNLLCPFCAISSDSHDHLFFKCEFSHLIWSYFCNKIGLNIFFDDWNDLILKLSISFKGNSVENLVNKCVFSSCVSHIWKERNSRLFSSRRNSHKVVISCIESKIQLKLLGLRKEAIMVNDRVFKTLGISGMDRI
ncbi:unnamed protein product [Lactuca virosa]|uniref:Reverse transcriptase zinc-binding domain-containing protein n=1 Tax=Lactuca virosa TaxID=75947 RepID=A0AAU9NCP3_9ASTR|nr:unnamed protein product [Lactuca virosa]